MKAPRSSDGESCFNKSYFFIETLSINTPILIVKCDAIVLFVKTCFDGKTTCSIKISLPNRQILELHYFLFAFVYYLHFVISFSLSYILIIS